METTDDWSRGTRGSPAAAAAADGEDASYARGDERGALNPLVPVDAPDAMVMDDRGDGALAAAAAAMREGFGGGLGAEGEGARARRRARRTTSARRSLRSRKCCPG